MYLYIN